MAFLIKSVILLLTLFSSAHSKNQKTSAHYLEKAWALEDQGRFDHAERVYRKAISKSTSDWTAKANLALLKARTGFLELAVKLTIEAIAVKKVNAAQNNVQLHLNAASFLERLGRDAKARKHYELALKVKPDSSATRGNLVQVLRRLRLYTDAVQTAFGAPSLADSVGNTYQTHNSDATDRSLWQHCLVLATAVTDLSQLLTPEKTRNALKRNAAGYTLHMCLRVATREATHLRSEISEQRGLDIATQPGNVSMARALFAVNQLAIALAMHLESTEFVKELLLRDQSDVLFASSTDDNEDDIDDEARMMAPLADSFCNMIIGNLSWESLLTVLRQRLLYEAVFVFAPDLAPYSDHRLADETLGLAFCVAAQSVRTDYVAAHTDSDRDWLQQLWDMYQPTCLNRPAQKGVVVTPEGTMSTFLQGLGLAHLEGSLAEGGITTIEELLEVQGTQELVDDHGLKRSQARKLLKHAKNSTAQFASSNVPVSSGWCEVASAVALAYPEPITSPEFAVAALCKLHPLHRKCARNSTRNSSETEATAADSIYSQVLKRVLDAQHIDAPKAKIGRTTRWPHTNVWWISISKHARNKRDQNAVQQFYEELPYPRWHALAGLVPAQPLSLRATLLDSLGEFAPGAQTVIQNLAQEKPALLVAGCGTGRDLLDTHFSLKEAATVGIDISRRSLAYAAYQASQHDVQNVFFINGNILQLDMLRKKKGKFLRKALLKIGIRAKDKRKRSGYFDVVVAVGVLHHLPSGPARGLKVLAKSMTQNGVILLGLYSTIGRKDIAQAKARLLNETGPLTTRNGQSSFSSTAISAAKLRTLRANIVSAKDGGAQRASFAAITSSADFYSTSGFRDMMAHPVEHTMTLLQVKDMLSLASLKFLGFHQLSKTAVEHYREMYRHLERRNQTRRTDVNDSLRNLDVWHRVEQKYPTLFRNMYRFWVAK